MAKGDGLHAPYTWEDIEDSGLKMGLKKEKGLHTSGSS